MDETSDAPPCTSQNAGDKSNISSHLVSMPKIILTRIDEGNLLGKPIKSNSRKKKSKPPVVGKKSKITVSKNFVSNKTEKRGRGRPRKIDIAAKIHMSKENSNKTIIKSSQNKIKVPKIPPKRIAKTQNNVVKNMLKKTMLQKRSKISIPQAKKAKPISNKATPTKSITPKTTKQATKPVKQKRTPKTLQKIDLPTLKPVQTDSSEDEFLYDELIEELENHPNKLTSPFRAVAEKKVTGPVKAMSEKTTNITLKPNVGNKPPTVVKGGIIKKVNLPADLKQFASTSNLTSSKSEQISATRKTKLLSTLDSPTPGKKPSPWPISIASPNKPSLEVNQNKNKKDLGPKTSVLNNASNSSRTVQKSLQPHATAKSVTDPNVSPKLISLESGRPKIGPKQTAKVVPLSKSSIDDDNSDEYTEEETLENIDYEPSDLLSKSVPEPTRKNSFSAFDSSKDDEDPNLDLLRILTDDSDDPVSLTSPESKSMSEQTTFHSNDGDQVKATTDEYRSSEPTISSNKRGPKETAEELPARTIYDLMNEISLQYPSWNLHIIPETNAFCIAQVIKGRLGLPTLKKCIELDHNTYSAKVYIHQYHIKRFDGVYDSEESIISLIQELNSIKA